MTLPSIASLIEPVRAAGLLALQAQKEMTFSSRSYKSDGSVVTQTDKKVEALLVEEIRRLFPEAGILGEEATRSFDPARPYTFAIDPIDGTDSFSQGLNGWCVCVGLLDGDCQPAAGIIYAPVMDLFLFADAGAGATLNDRKIVPPRGDDVTIHPQANLMVSSRLHNEVNLRDFPGKIRSIGSSALHICYAGLYPGICGTLQSPKISVWDIAAAHAIIRTLGREVERLDGGPFSYREMMDGSQAPDFLLAGTPAQITLLRGMIRRL
jgi:myo-inositol-1(or 4)-monophosphatase